MESIYTELALYDSKNYCARTDTVFLPISEVCNGTVSLSIPEVIKAQRKFTYLLGNKYVQLQVFRFS